MGAYQLPLNRQCQEPICHKQAVAKVYNTFNVCQGEFCAYHAQRKVKLLNELVATSSPTREPEK